ncbi:hypothetical protein HF325_005955 [Metschnikowia pulcherrima]|uniref:Uncharacterized protein n=1 Tax=Metschnikowia pulcherrima TaxID=27326 RepID=A0A8H7L8R3_9ASCO|nr:hypothetical protein HF325_005955 [Metschnikowia pulcherrima]
MKLFPVAYLTTLAFANITADPGVIYISKLADKPVCLNVRPLGNKLYAGGDKSIFRFNIEGTIQVIKSGMFLKVHENGRFSYDTKPHMCFFLKSNPGTTRPISYKNIDKFYLCGDDLIAIDSVCKGARPIALEYHELRRVPSNFIF